MQFATGDGRAAGHIGAVLLLGAAPGFTVAEARRVLGERIRAVPRLRQRLYRAPPGCGRPYWADDPAFDINEHVRQVCCPPPGDERAVLDLAAAQLREPMPGRGRCGRLRWFASHQRVVQTFVTNLHGPESPLTFGGAVVRAIIPIPSTTGNVTVTFAAASYAGTLRITILSDPSRVPDAPALAAALRNELSAQALRPRSFTSK
jgi:hypothetical protein